MKKRLFLSMLAIVAVLTLSGCTNSTKKPKVTKEGTLIHETLTYPMGPDGNPNFVFYETKYNNDGKILSYVSNQPGNEMVKTYEYNEEGKLVKEIADLKGQHFYAEYTFDENENLLTYYLKDTNSLGNGSFYNYTYTYDNDGNATECFVTYGGQTKPVWTRTYENGMLVKSIEQGKEHYPFFDANTYCNNTEVLYNDLGKMYHLSWTDDGNMNIVETITYNEQGLMTLIWSELANAEVDSFSYDEEGTQNRYLGASSFKYEYDEFGNKVKRTAYTNDGKEGFVTTYEYYYAE